MSRKFCMYVCLVLLPMLGLADEISLPELLARIRQTGQSQFRYEETRVLELASSPWHGQGFMLSDADGRLVKLQLQPARVIMAIADQSMYYWDPEQNQRHSAALGSAEGAAQQIMVFRSLLQGRTEDMQLSYNCTAEKQGKQWLLRMVPKPEFSSDETPTIEISGDEDDQQRRIMIRQAYGESTEYRLQKSAETQDSIQRLLQEAKGE